VLSETYQRSSTPTPEMVERDPDNRLYARQSRFRVEAEAVRDIALAASGLLTERLGGPSIRPPQPRATSPRSTIPSATTRPPKARTSTAVDSMYTGSVHSSTRPS
jgi:hypothetical protein